VLGRLEVERWKVNVTASCLSATIHHGVQAGYLGVLHLAAARDWLKP